MEPTEGMRIRAYGQEAEILRVEKDKAGYRCYLMTSIVVPGREYTRDYVHSDEIQEYL